MPLVGLIALTFWPSARQHQIKWVALGTSVITFGLSLALLLNFDSRLPGVQHEHVFQWLSFGNFKISYDVAWMASAF